MGIAYSIWSGLSVLLLTLVSIFFYKQEIDLSGAVGVFLIISGVSIIYLFSKSLVI